MIQELEEIEAYSKLKSSIILEGFRGSHAHGTYVPQHPDSIDDVDLMTVIIPPVDYYLGLKEFHTTEIKSGKWDIVVYDFKKFVSLLLKQNPNVLSLLWLQPSMYTVRTAIGEQLIKNRDLFSSREAYKSFTGYAYGQLKRMTHFQKYAGYMGEKRKKLVDKYGYDCKNSSHLIRLLKMGIEFLSTGQLNVLRHDNEMLIDIKYGKWKLEKVQEEADRLFQLADQALIHSPLPIRPDFEKVNELCVKLLRTLYCNTVICESLSSFSSLKFE